MRIAYLTAGGAGMFCGSCMHDNTLAAALGRLGCDVQLIPTYTPIRTDEENVSLDTVFMGGINVFLQEKFSLFRRLPGFMDRWLNRPWVIRRVATGNIETSASQLGALTVSMLRGEAGRQRKEIERLVRWLSEESRPQLLNLSNILIAGCVPAFRRRSRAPVLVTLQGDDLFLEGLVEPYRAEAISEIRKLTELIDGFIVFSEYYASFMSDFLQAPRDKFHVVPLGINVQDFPLEPPSPADRPPVVGYLARICEAKGLHILVDAFLRLKSLPGMQEAKLHIAGWLGKSDQSYFQQQTEKLARAGVQDSVLHFGTLDRRGKIEFLRGLDVLSVPTVYREPKGLYVLESLAAGVPVVQPEHGAFPEMLERTGGGRLVPPGDPTLLAEALHSILSVPPEVRRREAGPAQQRVHALLNAVESARHTLALYDRFLTSRDVPKLAVV